MKYAYRTPKLFSLQPLLRLFRSKGIGYSVDRFKGEREDRFFSVISVALNAEDWIVRPQAIGLKSEEGLEFMDIRFTKVNYKKFHEYMMETKAELALPRLEDSYMEQRVELSKEVLIVVVREDRSGYRGISNLMEDWGIRTDRLLKTKALLLKKAEGESIEQDLRGVPATDISGNTSAKEDKAIDQRFIQPMLEKHRLSAEIMEKKAGIFKTHKSSFGRRIIAATHSYSKTTGRPLYVELDNILGDTSINYAGSLLERYACQHLSETTLPDFLLKAELELKDAIYLPSGRKRNESVYDEMAKKIKKDTEESLKAWLDLNGVQLGLSMDTFIDRGFRSTATEYLSRLRDKISVAIKPKRKLVDGIPDMYETKTKSEYISGLMELNGLLGGHTDIETEIARAEGHPHLVYASHVPKSILELNKTEMVKKQDKDETILLDTLTSLTPQTIAPQTITRDGHNLIVCSEYPGFGVIYDELGVTPEKVHLEGIFYALKIMSHYTDKRVIQLKYEKGVRANYLVAGLGGLGRIEMDRKDDLRVAIHEAMHALEWHSPSICSLVTAFCASRFNPFEEKNIGRGEKAFSGLWDIYAGKMYDGDTTSEFITMGVQEFRSAKTIVGLAKKDYPHFLFTHALVTGKLKEYL